MLLVRIILVHSSNLIQIYDRFLNVIQSFNQLKKALKDWEMTYAVTSDINGKVAFSQLWTKNQTVNQGDLLFTIIPEQNSSYIAKLKTPAQNSRHP